jgi:hypothetical protein
MTLAGRCVRRTPVELLGFEHVEGEVVPTPCLRQGANGDVGDDGLWGWR